MKHLLSVFIATSLGAFAYANAVADTINMGYVSYDEGTQTPNIATFDIANETGANAVALGDPSFPVTGTAVNFSGLSLVVHFQNGSTQTFGQSSFTLAPDGLSFDGPGVPFGTGNDALSATLTGTFSPTSLVLTGGTTRTILDTFSATITDASGGPLQDGDLALITAKTTVTGVPEPPTLVLLALGLLGLALGRRSASSQRMAAALVLIVALGTGLALPVQASKLSPITTPSSGLSGTSRINLTASGFPVGATAADLTVSLAPTCGVGATVIGEKSMKPNSLVTIVGSTERIDFTIPSGLAKGTYFVWTTGTKSGEASTNCAVLVVTVSNTTLNACVPSSSLAVALGKTVVAYVPNGSWSSGTTGVAVVAIEGTSSKPTTIPTPQLVNACSSNPTSGETICTGNNTDVYVITGTKLTATLTSGSTNLASFSGGSCNNCGVAINALTNTAYVSGGFLGGGGVQPLNLATNKFSAPFKSSSGISENISIDPSRNLILNPSEAFSNPTGTPTYGLLKLDPSGNITAEFDNTTAAGLSFDMDSAAEDCTTGLALSSEEGTSNIFIADLTQAAYTSGSPGTWKAPAQAVFVGSDAGGGFDAGTDGIAVAPGTGHLGIVTGEFGGNTASVFLLPAASGKGTPGLADYAYFVIPSTPDGLAFSAGFDPHTITAYTSPNHGGAYGVIADWATGVPTWLAVIDLKKLLSLNRAGTKHTVDPTIDLVSAGAVRFVSTH